MDFMRNVSTDPVHITPLRFKKDDMPIDAVHPNGMSNRAAQLSFETEAMKLSFSDLCKLWNTLLQEKA